MGLKNAPASKVKPDNILDVIVAEEGSKVTILIILMLTKFHTTVPAPHNIL